MPGRWEAKNAANRKYFKKVAERRKKLLAQFSCYCCGDPDDTVIQWHHVIEKDKAFGIFDTARVGETKWWEEVMKCIPVCANCHVKIHKEKLCLINPTGYKQVPVTENIYAADCTCRP